MQLTRPGDTPKHTVIVDWDGTAVPAMWPERPAEFMPGFVDAMFRLHREGWVITIFSARLSPFDPWTSRRRPDSAVQEEIQYVRSMLDDAGLTFVRIWTLPGKPGGDYYVDDKALRYTGRPRSWERIVDTMLMSKGQAVFPAFDQEVAAKSGPTPEDFAWAAGFFDAEGSVSIYVRPERSYMRVTVAQKDRRPLEQLKAWFGGSLGDPRPSGVSNWTVQSQQAATFLRSVRPYLRVKHEQADVALEFQARRMRPADQLRGPDGRLLPCVDRDRDIADAERLKDLKRLAVAS